MNRKSFLTAAMLGAIAFLSLFFGSLSGVARADIAGPSLLVPDAHSWSTWVVVAVCVVVVVAVAAGAFFTRRARARRRAEGQGLGR